MGRPRKNSAEGQAALEARVAEAEAAHAIPETEPNAHELAAAVLDAIDLFKEKFPQDWAECHTWPLEGGLIHVAAKLRSLSG